jgi:lipoprotein-releasing system permease protein
MMVVPGRGSARASPKLAYFEVAAIIESQTELDATLALIGLGQAATLSAGEDVVSGLRLKIESLFSAPQLMYELVLGLAPGHYSSNWTHTHWNLYQAIQMSKNLVGLLMSLIVAIAAFNVVSTLVLVVVDKQGDIAILRTLGASGRTIMAVFMVQGAAIGLLGTIGGVLGGCLLALGIEDLANLAETLFAVQFLQSDVYPLTYLPTEIRLQDLVTVTATALAMSLLATLYPAWKASQVQPAVALRYE